MSKEILRRTIAMHCVMAALGSSMLHAQAMKGDWPVAGGDPGQNRWQKAESKMSPETVPGSFKLLWKIQLGKPAEGAFTEPLLAARLINAQGFKDIVYWPSSDSLYAVDSELGSLLWTKRYEVAGRGAGCGATSLRTVIEPPVVINFAARRAPGAPPPPQVPPMAPSARRLGVSPGGGGFGLRGIYVLTNDGMLHEQVLTTGADFAPPVKFLPQASGSIDAMNIFGKSVYATAAKDCPGVANGVWGIDIGAPSYPVASLPTGKVHALGLTGPAVAPDGTAFFVTGGGASDAAAGLYANSVIALGKEMKTRDWYTPAKAGGVTQHVSPATFAYKGKQYVVAPGANGSIVLLDAASLGGADHHTPLSETPSFTAPAARHGWDGFSTWLDKDGTAWVFASVSTAVASKISSAGLNGPTPHGAVIGFRLDDADQKPILTPVWVSKDMVNPAPPTVANGVVVALAGGSASSHATLSVLNATTGKELFSSMDTIPTSTGLSGVAVGDSHAFFTDRTGTLYCFGIGLEH